MRVKSPHFTPFFFFFFFKKMAEIKSFWIKYLDHNPVEIHTLYFNNQDRKPPLTNVGHLISAFKQRRGSLFADTDEGLITLYRQSCEGNTLEPLDPGDLLTGLGDNGNSSRNPLIIKSRNDDITMDIARANQGS